MFTFRTRKSTRNKYVFNTAMYRDLEELDDEIITDIKAIKLNDNRSIPQWRTSNKAQAKLKSTLKKQKGLELLTLLCGVQAFDIVLNVCKINDRPNWFSIVQNTLIILYLQGFNKVLPLKNINEINTLFAGQIQSRYHDQVSLIFNLFLDKSQRNIAKGVFGGVLAALAWRRKVANDSLSLFATGRNPPIPNFDDMPSTRDYEQEFEDIRQRGGSNVPSRESISPPPPPTNETISSNAPNQTKCDDSDFFKLNKGYMDPKPDPRKKKQEEMKNFFKLNSGSVDTNQSQQLIHSQNIETQPLDPLRITPSVHNIECFNKKKIVSVGIAPAIYDQHSQSNTQISCLFLSAITAKWLKVNHIDIDPLSNGTINQSTQNILFQHFAPLRDPTYINNELHKLQTDSGISASNDLLFSDGVEPVLNESNIDIINHLDNILDKLFNYGIKHEEFYKIESLSDQLVLNKTTLPFVIHKSNHFYVLKLNQLDSEIIHYVHLYLDTLQGALNVTYPRNAIDCINLIISLPNLNEQVLELIRAVQVCLAAINILNPNSEEHKQRMRWEIAECLSGRHFWPRHTVRELELNEHTYKAREIREWCQNEFELNNLSTDANKITDANYLSLFNKLDPAFQKALSTFFYRGVRKSIQDITGDIDLQFEPVINKIITNLCVDLMNDNDQHIDLYLRYLTIFTSILKDSLFKSYTSHSRNNVQTGHQILLKRRDNGWCRAKIMGIDLEKEQYLIAIATSLSFTRENISSIKILPVL
eukprot:136375_1